MFAISVIGNVLVLDAKITWLSAALSSSAYTFFLRSIISGTASITKSLSCTASFKSTIGVILEIILLRSSSEIFSFDTSLSKLHLIFSIALSKNLCSMSLSTTLYPAIAETWEIPCPIIPEPNTVTFLISISFKEINILYNMSYYS